MKLKFWIEEREEVLDPEADLNLDPGEWESMNDAEKAEVLGQWISGSASAGYEEL